MQYNQKDLFDRLVSLKIQALQTKEDIKILKKDFSFHKEDNTDGLEKSEVKLIDKASSLHAKNNFEETESEALSVFEKYKEIMDE